MIDKLGFSVARTGNRSLFHDSQGDVRTLAHALNISIIKIDELVEVVNRQNKEIEILKGEGQNFPPTPKGPPIKTGD